MKRHGGTFLNVIDRTEKRINGEKRRKRGRKPATWKSYVLSNSTALWKRQNCGHSGCVELEEESERAEQKDGYICGYKHHHRFA